MDDKKCNYILYNSCIKTVDVMFSVFVQQAWSVSKASEVRCFDVFICCGNFIWANFTNPWRFVKKKNSHAQSFLRKCDAKIIRLVVLKSRIKYKWSGIIVSFSLALKRVRRTFLSILDANNDRIGAVCEDNQMLNYVRKLKILNYDRVHCVLRHAFNPFIFYLRIYNPHKAY